ncbi:hypothetical protein GOV13_03630 [Candidatus Pacearchaeota archaeon]|nr:hypothetical protein [Candidatus Pacearchaeota archaeon]
MKLLVIGDFHGKFPKKLQNRIKKEKVDLVVSLGDYSSWSLISEFFKHCYRKDIELWEVVGKTKYKESTLKDLKTGQRIISQLNNLPMKVISITGNHDFTKWKEAHKMYDKPVRSKWKWPYKERFSSLIKNFKNIEIFDWSYVKFRGFVFIGYPNSNFPGHVQSKQYRLQRKKLDKLFNRFKKENKEGKVIFVSHNVPYGSKLGVVTAKTAHEKARGKNHGSKLARRIIDKWRPRLVLCGHMHEHQGTDKIGKSLILNSGPAFESKAVVIDIDENMKKKIKVKFIK